MAVITLISDMGSSDHYVAAVKGTLLAQLKTVNIVDISHDIQAFNILQAAFLLKNSYHHFPPGTIHIIGVVPEADEQTNHLAISYQGHYFIGADNGIFSLIFNDEPDHIVVLPPVSKNSSLTFPTKDVFAPAAIFIAKGGKLEKLGAGVMDYRQSLDLLPAITSNVLKGNVIHIDHYGNIITNISRSLFEEQRQERKFTIVFGKSNYQVSEISMQYNDVGSAKAVALFNADGYLEIAINKGATGHGGGAASLLGIKIHDVIRIEFD